MASVNGKSRTEQHTRAGLPIVRHKMDKKVKWDEGTVDNEHMNKKKSKSCCIYYGRQRSFGDLPLEDTNLLLKAVNNRMKNNRTQETGLPPSL
ncbi:E3 ubiquitin-protein ligase PPP1R11-like [Ptychodera flava]|uniref:E3 ubiquitin-protein ligase PPP1R11-like n=1 Tax=Ptychodera flava TaxID=63121 RepID=UPI00396A0BB6